MVTPEQDQDAPSEPVSSRPQPQRIRMTLSEQATFLGLFVNRFRMRDGSVCADLMTAVSQDDMMRFETIWQTMLIMELHGADGLIRDKIARDRRSSLPKK